MIQPIEFNVLIKPLDIDQKTKGGIILVDQTVEADRYAQQRGTIAAVSPLAFSYADWPEGTQLPKVGDTVFYGKYAGTMVKDDDGTEYRLVKDKEIAAVIQ
jgi:co-chaperonin GroES (HSP10)